MGKRGRETQTEQDRSGEARFILANAIWTLHGAAGHDGRPVFLKAAGTGPVLDAQPPMADAVDEGGHLPFFGLDVWVKTGAFPDHNTGVLSAFTPLHRAPRQVASTPEAIEIRAAAEGLALWIEWRLPAGKHPLRCRARLENTGAPAADFQFECFFPWTLPPSRWNGVWTHVPGLRDEVLAPFGQLSWAAADVCPDDPVAVWRTPGEDGGVVLRAGSGVARFTRGIQAGMLMLGAMSPVRRLLPGEVLEMELALTPPVPGSMRIPDARPARPARVASSVAAWAVGGRPPAIPQRAVHLTLQYLPVDLREVHDLIRRVIAPAGYNQLLLEIGRAFPYRSHPRVSAPWAYRRRQWRDLLACARDAGLAVIPEYNSFAHQAESGLAAAYPELAADPWGWALDPEHPDTHRFLGDLYRELVDFFEPSAFCVGMDEVDKAAGAQTFPVFRDGRRRDDGADLLAMHVNRCYEMLAPLGVEVQMAADMLLYQPGHHSLNGLRPGTWRAIDRIPREVVLWDWVYHPVSAYGGSEYLLSKGFRVMGMSWHVPATIPAWARYARSRLLPGLCQTTWTPPTLRQVPLVCMLLAGRYFNDPSAGPDADILTEAEALAWQLAGARLD